MRKYKLAKATYESVEKSNWFYRLIRNPLDSTFRWISDLIGLKKIDKLIFTYFFPTFIITFFIALFVIVCQFLYVWMDEIIGKGLDWLTIFEFLFYLVSYKIPMALPLAILMASLVTFGGLGENYELAVIKSSGISLLKAMRGSLVMIGLMSIGAFFISNYYLPFSALKVRVLLHDIREKAPAFGLEEQAFYNEIDGFSIRIGKKSEDNKQVSDIMIYDHRSGRGNTNVLKAEKGVFSNLQDKQVMIFELENGEQYEEIFKKQKGKKKHEHSRVKFKTWKKTFDMSSFSFEESNESFFKNSHSMLTLSQLEYAIDSIKKTPKRESKRLAKSNNNYLVSRAYLNDSSIIISDSLLKDTLLLGNYIDQFDDKTASKLIDKAKGTCRNVKSTSRFFRDRIVAIKRDIRLHYIEWNRKFTLSISCIMFFLIGAPLGAIIRKGGFGMPMIIIILLYIFFHVMATIGEKMAKDGSISAEQGMWIPILIFLPIGLYLTFKVTYEGHFKLFKK